MFVAIASLAVASALPMLKPAVSAGVLLEESAHSPTFAAGIRTDCNYESYDDRDLGNVFARGDDQKFTLNPDIQDPSEAEEDALKAAKVACDDMGTDCGGVVKVNTSGSFFFQIFQGTVLKKDGNGAVAHVKGLCAFPLPYSNFIKGENHHDELRTNDGNEESSQGSHGTQHGAGTVVHKFNHVTNIDVERLRWKLSNGPSYDRIDDNKDHGFKSRISDGISQQLAVEDCMAACSKRTDCMTGHYCESGEGTVSGKCFLSGDWDPYGIDPEYDGCDLYRNFRQQHEWVKPVERLDDGKYVKEQWHSKTPIDVAYAQQAAGEDSAYEEEDDA